MGWLSITKCLARYSSRKVAEAERNWVAPDAPSSVPIKTALANLKSDTGLSRDYLSSLVKRVRYESGIQEVMQYIKSDAATNLTLRERTELWLACLEKLKWIDAMRQFLE